MRILHIYSLIESVLIAKADTEKYVRSDAVARALNKSYNAPLKPIACIRTSDCDDTDWICINKQCVANSIHPVKRILGVIGTFASAALASGCGLGGGGLLVPLYILTLHLSPQEAIPLSKVCKVIEGWICDFSHGISRQRHPHVASRRLIDFDAVLLMEPMTLAGTVIGVTMITILPDYMVTILLVWLLYTTSTRMLKKAYNILHQESQKETDTVRNVIKYWQLLPLRKKTAHFQIMAFVYLKWKAPTLKANKASSKDIQTQSAHQFTSDDCQDQLLPDKCETIQPSLLRHSAHFSYRGSACKQNIDNTPIGRNIHTAQRNLLCDVGVLSLTWLSLIFVSLVKGGHGASSVVGIECGSYSYWGTIISMPLFFCGVTAHFAQRILKQRVFLESCGYRYAQGEIRWDRHSVVRYPGLCTLAGVAAGMLGIGGGMVKGPLLLEIGCLPQVASATSSTMIFFTSSATVIQYIILGSLDWTQALQYGSIGFLAGIMGQFGVAFMIRKYRKTAFVIFMLAGVIGTSGLCLGVLGLHNFYRNGYFK
ncbi:unnamed protein product [Albugo candida]|uniref:Uncharacterized protein n=1 Tax=Albugo candida TaxID=65357 RepID=A0A024G4L5_9STRA|nr:unnamed protein product [Albugo candida]|eukprot:CCI41706.1 unnamed protein product [Albugo candida]